MTVKLLIFLGLYSGLLIEKKQLLKMSPKVINEK